MKKLRLYPITALVLLSLHVPAWGVETGQTAPDFDLPGNAGNIKLSALKGKTVYLDFWASWCGPCRQSFPWMNEMQSRYGSKGLRVVGLNVDQQTSDAKSFLKETPANFDVAFDAGGATPRSYAVKTMPTSILIGPDGKVLAVHNGFKKEHRDELERQIKAALNIKD